MQLSRRAFLGTVGTGVAAGAGCLDFAAGEGPQGPAGTPDRLDCPDEGFRRLVAPFDDGGVQYVTAQTTAGDRFELAAQGTAESYGNELRLTLRNLSDAEVTIGNDALVTIQRQTGAGWQDVRGTTDGGDPTYPEGTTTVGNGGGFTWSVTLHERGVAALGPDGLEVCPALGAGLHRFVYWGLPDDVAVAREFTIVG